MMRRTTPKTPAFPPGLGSLSSNERNNSFEAKRPGHLKPLLRSKAAPEMRAGHHSSAHPSSKTSTSLAKRDRDAFSGITSALPVIEWNAMLKGEFLNLLG